jgi:hypothetical protein
MSYRHNPPKDVLSYEIRPGRRCPLVTCGPAPPGWKREYGTSDERNPDGCLRYPCGKLVPDEYQDVDQVYNPKRLNVELAVSLNNHYEKTHYYKNIPEVTFNLENSSIIGIGKFG